MERERARFLLEPQIDRVTAEEQIDRVKRCR
jgi:hypothetical protein